VTPAKFAGKSEDDGGGLDEISLTAVSIEISQSETVNFVQGFTQVKCALL